MCFKERQARAEAADDGRAACAVPDYLDQADERAADLGRDDNRPGLRVVFMVESACVNQRRGTS